MTMRNALHMLALFGGILIAITLWFWGQPPICTCGYVQLWVNSIFSSGNSQHIADWYTLSHIVHGLLIAPLARLLFPRLAFTWVYLAAIVTGAGWEIVEHTPWVLDQFRATTLNQGYLGDSVLNAVMDYVFMMSGFFAGAFLSGRLVLVLIAFLEITAATVARDSLILETIMLIYPVEAIEEWQQELNPRRDMITG